MLFKKYIRFVLQWIEFVTAKTYNIEFKINGIAGNNVNFVVKISVKIPIQKCYVLS